MSVARLDGLEVRYGSHRVLSGVSCSLEAGSVTVVIGGDGAGKTTLLRTVAGLVRPSRGRLETVAREELGYVPSQAGCYGDLTVAENLAFVAAAYRRGRAEVLARGAELLEATSLEPARDRLASELSGGMRRQLGVVLALAHAPKLLVLDEPTTGVDPVSRAALWRLIAAAAADGAAVLVATTYVNEAARGALALLLEGGRVLAAGPPADLLAAVPGALGRLPSAPAAPVAHWRRGASWRCWVPDGRLPEGATAVEADFEDAVVVAELAAARQ